MKEEAAEEAEAMKIDMKIEDVVTEEEEVGLEVPETLVASLIEAQLSQMLLQDLRSTFIQTIFNLVFKKLLNQQVKSICTKLILALTLKTEIEVASHRPLDQ